MQREQTPSGSGSANPGVTTAKSIAVLPLVNMSSSAENEYFSDGMTEEIINALAKVKGLKVTSRTSSFYFKGKNIPIRQIGEELNVSTILEGSIRLSGNMMRITAQLIDVAEDYHFWSETFDRPVEDIFAVQDEISLLIADKLREEIGHFEIAEQLVEAPGIPVEVYKRYLQGRYYLMKLDLPNTEKAIEIFKEVIAAQPDFAHAYLDINQGYAYLGTMGMIPAHEGYAKGKVYLDQALRLNENLPESQLNLAWVACWQHWDFAATYRHLNLALEIRPTDNVYLTIANTLSVEGKFEASFTYIDKALQLDPLAAMNHHFKGFLYYLTEKYAEAIPHYQKSLELKPELHFPHQYWGAGLLLEGKPEAALAYFQNLPELARGDLTKVGGTALAYAAMGAHAEAAPGIAALEAALETPAVGSAMDYLIRIRVVMGELEAAMALIEQAMAMRLPTTLLFYTEPLLKPLRSHARFQEIMRQIFGADTNFEAGRKKYKKSLLKPELREQYQRQLTELMQAEKPYLDPGLSLRSLAQRLAIPANHLSQLLNEGFDKNFSEYVNAHRLEAFKSKVADPGQRHLTILALAYDSGFNSKTVFNTFFKKTMGQTPRAYWNEIVRE